MKPLKVSDVNLATGAKACRLSADDTPKATVQLQKRWHGACGGLVGHTHARQASAGCPDAQLPFLGRAVRTDSPQA